jgi:hypothetical protein
MFLNVKDFGGGPPGIATGILRELIKAVALGCFFGMIWALQGVVTRDQIFYVIPCAVCLAWTCAACLKGDPEHSLTDAV